MWGWGGEHEQDKGRPQAEVLGACQGFELGPLGMEGWLDRDKPLPRPWPRQERAAAPGLERYNSLSPPCARPMPVMCRALDGQTPTWEGLAGALLVMP